MTPDRRRRVRELFDEAAALDTGARGAFLDAACAGDADLRAEVEGLLKYDSDQTDGGDSGPFLKSPVVRPPGTSPSAPFAAPALPQQVGRYRVLGELGSGGMGVVYEAEQDNPRRAVALKVIRAGRATPSLAKRFAHEAHFLGRLQHPGVAQVYDAGLTAEGLPFLAMELVRGTALDRYARENHLDVPARLALFARVCDAVQHAHDSGIVHRDLKPGNVLVDAAGQPKVLDFGVARAADDDFRTAESRTEVGQIVGTLNYMSPEQLTADPAQVDRRSDVYALGVVLFELLADRLPYDLVGLPLPEVARVIREQDPSSLGSVDRALRGDVETIVAKALEKDRARRYASAAELAADIRRHLGNEPIRARRASAAYLLRKFARRHKPLVAGVTAVVAALVVGLVGTTWFALEEAAQRRRAEDATRDEATARGQAEKNRVRAEDNRAQAEKNQAQAERNEAQAKKNEARAEENRRAGRRSLYLAEVRLAHQAWERGQADVMTALLASAAHAEPGDEDLRRFEWHHLWRKANPAGRVIRGPETLVMGVSFSPDGRRVAGSGYDGFVRVWDVADGRLVHTLAGHFGEVSGVRFHPDGKTLASCGNDGTVRVWDAAAGTPVRHWKSQSPVWKLEFNRTGRRLVTGEQDGSVCVWDYAGGKELLRIPAHDNVRGVAYSPDGTRVASAGADGFVRVWDLDTQKALFSVPAHAGAAIAVAFSPDGKRVVSGGEDRAARVWDAATGQALQTYTGHTDIVRTVAFSPDGTRVASAGLDRVVRVWDDDGATVAAVAHGVRVESLAFSRDGKQLALGDLAGVVRVLDLASPTNPGPLRGHQHAVRVVAFSPDGKRLASAGEDGTVRLWDVFGGVELRSTPVTFQPVHGLAFGPAGDVLASAGFDRTARLCSAADLRPLRTYGGDPTTGQLQGLSFDPDGTRFATGSRDGVVRVWQTTGRLGPLALIGHAGGVQAVAFGPGGRLASGGDDKVVRVWDVGTGKVLQKMEGHTGEVWGVTFRPGGREVASVGRDNTVRVWDAATGEPRHVLRGHADKVSAAAYNPDGSRLASAGMDRTVHVWDATSGQQLLTLRGATGWVTCLAFSPDGLWLAGGDAFSSVWVW